MDSIPFGHDLDVRQLRCFVAVAEAGTVTAAAQSLGIGQPAASRQLQQLERQLRVPLFLREHGRLLLTAAGRELLELSREALGRVDRVGRTARELAAGRLEQVRLASTGTTRDDVLAPWVATWGPEAPMPTLEEAPVDGLHAALRTGADLVVTPMAAPPRLSSLVVADLPMWACVAPGHPWASRGAVGLAELSRADLLLLTRNFHARRVLDGLLPGAHEPLAEFTSPIAAQAVAASGRGVCVLTDDPRFGLVPLSILDEHDQPLMTRLHAAWEPSHHAAGTLKRLAVDLQHFVHERYRLSTHPA